MQCTGEDCDTDDDFVEECTGDDCETDDQPTVDLSCAGEDLFGDQALEVAGIWNDNYGGWVITDDSNWGHDTIHQFDNEANWVITQSPADNLYTPNQYSKVVWTEPAADGVWWGLYGCIWARYP